MPALQFDEKKVRTTIDLVVKRTMKMDFSWDWPAGVAFYGISRAWEVTGDKSYIDFLANWADGFIKAGPAQNDRQRGVAGAYDDYVV